MSIPNLLIEIVHVTALQLLEGHPSYWYYIESGSSARCAVEISGWAVLAKDGGDSEDMFRPKVLIPSLCSPNFPRLPARLPVVRFFLSDSPRASADGHWIDTRDPNLVDSVVQIGSQNAALHHLPLLCW